MPLPFRQLPVAIFATTTIALLVTIVFLYTQHNSNKQKTPPTSNPNAKSLSASESTQPLLSSREPFTEKDFLKKIQQIPDDITFIAFLKRELAKDEEAVLKALKNADLSKFSTRHLSKQLSLHFAEKNDALGVIDLFKETFGDSEKRYLYDQVAAYLLEGHSHNSNSQDVLDFILKPENKLIYLNSVPGVGGQLVKGTDHPEGMMQALESLPEAPNKEELLAGALTEWMKTDLHAVLSYIEDKPQRHAHDTFLFEMFKSYNETDPVAIMEWLPLIKDEYYKETAVVSTAVSMANQSPKEFEKWLSDYPDSELKKRIIQITSPE